MSNRRKARNATSVHPGVRGVTRTARGASQRFRQTRFRRDHAPPSPAGCSCRRSRNRSERRARAGSITAAAQRLQRPEDSNGDSDPRFPAPRAGVRPKSEGDPVHWIPEHLACKIPGRVAISIRNAVRSCRATAVLAFQMPAAARARLHGANAGHGSSMPRQLVQARPSPGRTVKHNS